MENQLMMAMGLNTTGFKQGINEASRLTNNLGVQLKNIAAGFGIAFGVTKLVGYLKEAGDEYIKTEQTVAKINQTLKNQGDLSEKHIDHLKKQREEYQKIGIAQKDIADAQLNIESRFSHANEPFKDKLLQAAVDKGGDITSNIANIQRDMLIATQLMKSDATGKLTHPAHLSGRIAHAIGIEANELDKLNEGFKHMATKNEVNVATLDVISAHYAKIAEEVRKANPFQEITNLLTPLKFEMGKFIVGVGKELVPYLRKGIEWLRDTFEKNKDSITKGIVEVAKDLISFGTGIKEAIVGLKPIGDLLLGLAKSITPTSNGFEELGKIFVFYKIGSMFTSLLKGIGGLVDFFGGGLKKVTAVMNVEAAVVNITSAIGGNGIPGVAGKVGKGVATGEAAVAAEEATAIGLGVVETLTAAGAAIGIVIGGGILGYMEHKRLAALHPSGLTKEQAITPNVTSGIVAPIPVQTPYDSTHNWPVLLQAIAKNTKKAAEKSGEKENSGEGNKMDIANSTVKGAQAKQIIINIHDGLVKSMVNNFSTLAESAKVIEETITQAILDGIMAGERLMPN